MRFFRKKNDAPRWVDSALDWTPEEPLEAEPKSAAEARFAPGNDIGWTDDWRPEPRAAAPLPEPARQPEVTALVPLQEPIREAARETIREVPPAPANLNRAPRLWHLRLAIGAAQGLLVWALLAARDIGVWPGSDPAFFTALMLAAVFAPLLFIEALGEVETRLLALWCGTVATLMGTLGLYHAWRIEGVTPPGYTLFTLCALIGLMLFPAQVMLRALLRDGARPAYRTLADESWTLAARLLVWAIAAGFAWSLIGSGNSLLNWLRQRDAAFDLGVAPLLVILPLVGLASASALQLTANGSPLRRAATMALLTCATIALPLLVLASGFAITLHVSGAPLSATLATGLALGLLLAFNASYRDGADRALWRRIGEFAAAFLIVALIAIAALALKTRVDAQGWTGLRVLAAATMALIGAHGMAYACAALIALGGGRWMQRIEWPNRVLGVVLILMCLALASPLADPVKLAVTAQAQRVQTLHTAEFDFAWLRRKGLRFGRDALMTLTRDTRPEIARDAAITLSVAPGADAPTPTEIGANIIVRTPGARLPNALLEPDWKAYGDKVPPCLTKPALSCEAWFLDMDRDGRNEILLVYGNDARWWAAVMQDGPAGWHPAATLASPACRGSLDAMRQGWVGTVDPLPGWRDLLVAGIRLTPQPATPTQQPCQN